jgi:hypothetical protein
LQHKGGTFCHLPGWSRVVERTWDHAPRHLAAFRGHALVGVLPLFHVKSRIVGSSLISIPNAVYGGALGDDEIVCRALLDSARALGQRLRVNYVELRSSCDGQSHEGLVTPLSPYVRFERPITADEDALMASFPRDIRRMIRLGSSRGLVARRGGADLLDRFYEVVLSFYFRDSVLPYYGGAYPEFHRAGVNNFMYFALMKSAAAGGYRRFDFGRSKLATGACSFKRGWHMREEPLRYAYFLVRSTHVPDVTPLSPRFKLLVAAWKRLPLAVSKVIGPPIVRHLP